MKRIISAFLAIMLACTIFPCGNVKAASDKKEAGEAYAVIIQKYLDAYEAVKDNNYDAVDEDVNAEYLGAFYNKSDVPVYRIFDFNGDGSLELFIGVKQDNTYVTIYDVYTFQNGKAVQLMNGIGYRAGTCSLRKNGIIADNWSGSAFESGVIYHKLPKNKTKLSDVVEVQYITNEKTGKMTYKKIVKGKTTTITEAQAKKIEKKYSAKQKVTFYQLTSKAVKNVKQGKLTYSGQKNWKATT